MAEEMSVVGLFAQMWALELAAFLLGAAVTWLVFVRPARAAAVRAAQPVHLPPAWASGEQPVPSLRAPDTEPPTVTTDSALAALDAHARHARRSGLFAADVLEQLSTTSPLPVVDAADGKKR
jgi:hypothetical protein